MTKESTVFMTHFEVEMMLRRENEASLLSICLDMKPLLLTKLCWKPNLVGYVIPRFEKLDERKGNTREHVICSLDCIEAHATNVDLCMRVFSKPLTARAHLWFVNMKSDSVLNLEHIVTLLNTKSFYA